MTSKQRYCHRATVVPWDLHRHEAGRAYTDEGGASGRKSELPERREGEGAALSRKIVPVKVFESGTSWV